MGSVGKMTWVIQDTITWNPTMHVCMYMIHRYVNAKSFCKHYACTNVSQQV